MYWAISIPNSSDTNNRDKEENEINCSEKRRCRSRHPLRRSNCWLSLHRCVVQEALWVLLGQVFAVCRSIRFIYVFIYLLFVQVTTNRLDKLFKYFGSAHKMQLRRCTKTVNKKVSRNQSQVNEGNWNIIGDRVNRIGVWVGVQFYRNFMCFIPYLCFWRRSLQDSNMFTHNFNATLIAMWNIHDKVDKW